MDLRYAFPALDVATQRGGDVFALEFANEWEARDARQAAESATDGGRRPLKAPRALARAFAAVRGGSAAAVRRLDDVAADELRRTLTPSK